MDAVANETQLYRGARDKRGEQAPLPLPPPEKRAWAEGGKVNRAPVVP